MIVTSDHAKTLCTHWKLFHETWY